MVAYVVQGADSFYSSLEDQFANHREEAIYTFENANGGENSYVQCTLKENGIAVITQHRHKTEMERLFQDLVVQRRGCQTVRDHGYRLQISWLEDR